MWWISGLVQSLGITKTKLPVMVADIASDNIFIFDRGGMLNKRESARLLAAGYVRSEIFKSKPAFFSARMNDALCIGDILPTSRSVDNNLFISQVFCILFEALWHAPATNRVLIW